MSMSQIDPQKTQSAWKAFSTSRDVNIETCDKLFARLAEFESCSNGRHETIETNPSGGGSWSTALSVIQRMPRYLRQWQRRGALVGKTWNIAAIASGRLPLIGGKGFRETLRRNAAELGSEDSALPETESYEEISVPLVLFDPMFHSQYWEHEQALKAENVCLIDTGYLLFTLLLVVLVHPIQFYRMTQALGRGGLDLKLSVLFSLITEHLKGADSYDLILYTSNSTQTEILRIVSLQDENRCGVVIELLHGILAKPTVDYIVALQKLCADNMPKLKLVPQVPNLPELSMLGGGSFYADGYAINPYLNRTLRNHIASFSTLQDYAKNRLGQIGIDNEFDGRVLTVFGGTSPENLPYYLTLTFRLELEWAVKALVFAKLNKQPMQLIYAPHPANGPIPQEAVTKLKDRGFVVVEDSVFCYLCTDVCISIFSSCLFELQWIGANAFSPLLDSDSFFSSEYLDLLSHPSDGSAESLDSAIESACNNLSRETDVLSEISLRAEKILGRSAGKGISQLASLN